jgi:hypothetical protein
VDGSCGHGNELWGSIICWEMFELLSEWQLLKKDSAPGRHLVRNVISSIQTVIIVSTLCFPVISLVAVDL